MQSTSSAAARKDTLDTLAAFEVQHDLELSLDGDLLETFRVGEPPPDADRGSDEYRAWRDRQRSADENWVLRVPVLAGPRTLRATFRKKTSAYPETLRQPYLRPYTNTTAATPATSPTWRAW